MADSSNSTPPSNKDLQALATRLRDRADAVIADRAAANDMRQTADLASQWASIREGWKNPDLSLAAIQELNARFYDEAPAVLTSDVFLAMLAVDSKLLPLIERLRHIPNAPDNVNVREYVLSLLKGIDAEAFTAEQSQTLLQTAGWC
jgi:hypothetical protein